MPRCASGADNPGETVGTLFVVATPLGNLKDITLRALRTLKEVDWIAAEDTRRTRKLLSHYGIRARLVRADQWVERAKTPRIVDFLRRGGRVALVSDAGTPGIRDPGCELVRAAATAGVRVVPVPGPSAVPAALSASGMRADRFVFEGFVPSREGERRQWLMRMEREERTWVCFETARRLPSTLTLMREILRDRPLVVARELTKRNEEFLRGSAEEVLRVIEGKGQPLRGEVTIVVEGKPAGRTAADGDAADWREALAQALAGGESLREAARAVAERCGVSRRLVYQYGLRLRARQ